MGNSKSRGDDRYLSSHNGKHEIKKQVYCPICNLAFLPKTLYSVIDAHIESHKNPDDLISIPEDHFFPKAEEKILPIRGRISTLKVPWSVSHCEIQVSRENLLRDSKLKLLSMTCEELRSEFHIKFLGENSSDAGGLTKEWLNLIVVEFLSEKNQFFELTKCENPKYIPVRTTKNSEYYRLFGIVLGKAVLENIPLNCELCRVLFKHLLGKSCSMRDVKYIDADLYNSTKYMLENSVDGVFFESFSVVNGKGSINLIDGGDSVPVTEENKETYILLRIEYEVYGAFAPAIERIKEGFFSVIPENYLEGLGYKELNYMISGNPFINLHDWMSNTEYSGEFSPSHKVIIWFWECVCRLQQPQQRRLLQFVTGTSQVPIEGFSNLKTIRGDAAKFKIIPVSFTTFALPRAHTCFNRLDLPVYSDKAVLQKALNDVLSHHIFGFGID